MDYIQPIFKQETLRKGYDLKTIVIPYWIQQVIQRNKLDYIDVLNYSKMSKILATEDFAQLVSCNMGLNHKLFDHVFGDSFIDLKWMEAGVPSELNLEFSNVLKLAKTEYIQKNVTDRLYADDFNISNVKSFDTLYRFQTLNDNTVLVFIERGLLNALENREFAKAFFSDNLKVLYSLLPISDVSKHSTVFRQYLELLL